jgi:hypothetical protein
MSSKKKGGVQEGPLVKMAWERGWGGGGRSDEDMYEVLIMDDRLRKLLPDGWRIHCVTLRYRGY